jgi:glycerol-3-phosphate dehydrogenase (NAD(P)+)
VKAAVIGDGGWGTALATVLIRNGHEVSVWGPFPEYLAEVRRTRENSRFLPGVIVPEGVHWVADPAEAAREAGMVVLAVPSRYFREVVQRFRGLVPEESLVVSVTKGLDRGSGHRMSEVAGEILQRDAVAALSGPSHAEEVARGVPTAVVVACSDQRTARGLQSAFNRPEFRVYSSDDVVGVELGGALKNVIAIAAGVSDGIGYGDNTKAALMTRGLAEVRRLAMALGAHPATCSGLSGVGDLFVTCTSRLSRNRRVGERLGQGETLERILEGMQQIAEGVWTCDTARRAAARCGVTAPIIEEVCAVVHRGKDPRAAVASLLAREPRPERDDAQSAREELDR